MEIQEIKVENGQPLIVNGQYFQCVAYIKINPKNQKQKEILEIRSITKKSFDRLCNMYKKPCGKTRNNPSAQTSDGVVGEGGFG